MMVSVCIPTAAYALELSHLTMRPVCTLLCNVWKAWCRYMRKTSLPCPSATTDEDML